MEWREWCRLCGIENGNQNDIFIKKENCSNISETIHKHLLITIYHNDNIPSKICTPCNEFVLNLSRFCDKTNKVQQMFLELEYHMKLNTQVNLSELRIKYGIDNFEIKQNENLATQRHDDNKLISKCEPQDLDLISIRKRNTSKSVRKKSLPNSNTNNFSATNDDILTERNIAEKIKTEIDQDTKIINEMIHELKIEQNNISEEENENGTSSIDYNNHSEIEEYVPHVYSKKTQIKKLRNKRSVTYITQIDDNTKRVKKKYKEEEKSIQCEMCPKKFIRENNLSTHLKKAHKVVKILPPCEYCGKVCKTKQKLKFHRELHLPSEERQKLLFKCPLCDQKFTQKGAMRSHIRGTHSHERPFICEACGKTFTSQSNLWAHRKKTHEEDMMSCEICQKICKNSSSLRKHMSTHKEPSIPCSICGILLKTKKTLKNHMLVHSDIKAFQCNYCGKEFKRDITLQLHMIIHSGLKPYVCRFCEQTYANPSNCKKHEKHSHAIEYQAAEGVHGPSQPQRVLKKLPNIKQLKAMLEDMKAAKENS